MTIPRGNLFQRLGGQVSLAGTVKGSGSLTVTASDSQQRWWRISKGEDSSRLTTQLQVLKMQECPAIITRRGLIVEAGDRYPLMHSQSGGLGDFDQARLLTP